MHNIYTWNIEHIWSLYLSPLYSIIMDSLLSSNQVLCSTISFPKKCSFFRSVFQHWLPRSSYRIDYSSKTNYKTGPSYSCLWLNCVLILQISILKSDNELLHIFVSVTICFNYLVFQMLWMVEWLMRVVVNVFKYLEYSLQNIFFTPI